MSIQVSEATLAEIKQAIFRGQKIEAIKLYREYTETGLTEAKTDIEELEAELRSAAPDKFLAAPLSNEGFGASPSISVRAIVVVVVICLIAVAVVWRLKGK